MVVIWPKQYAGLIKLDQNFNGIHERLKKEFHELPKDQPAPSVFAKKMDTMAFFCGKNPRKIGPGNLEGLLPMCQTEKQVQAVLGALAQVGHLPGSAANLVEKYGWGSAVGQKVGACLAAVGGSGSYHGEKAKPGLRLVRGFLEDGKEFGVEAARKFLGAYLESKIRRDDKHPDFEFEDPGFLADVYLCLRRCRPELEDLIALFLAGARALRTGKLVALLGEGRLKAEVAAGGLPELAGLLSRSLLRPPERKLGGYDFSSYHAYSAAVAKQAKEPNAPTVSVADAQAALEFGLSLGDGAGAAALLRDAAEFLLAVAPTATLAGLFSPKGGYAPETALLKALKAGGSGSRPLRELCQAVLNRAKAPAKPALCLRFPGATVPHDAGFEAFLRGNEEKWVRRGFGGEKYARAWAEAVAGPQVCGAPAVWPGAYGSERGFPLHDAGKTWEVTCKRQGGGDATCLLLTKSRAKYEQALRDYSAATQEASRLRGYLQAGGGEITEGMEELDAAVAARKEVETKAFAAEAAAAKKAADEAAAAAAAAAAAKKTANAAAASAAPAAAAPPASGAAGAAAGGNKKPRAKKQAKPKPADPTHTLRTVTVEGGRGSQADKCLVDGRSGVARFALAPGQGLAQLKAELRKRFGKAKGQRLGALHVVVGGVPSAKPAKPADLVEGARLRASYVAAMGNPGSLRPFRPGRGHPGFRGGGGYGDEDGCAVM
uniref:Uncharacterized protein n=1 Tax=Heterosigma akashiwo TaxID=2829 RepID=A0A7S3XVI1_HETAK